jgi:hypothetical protein
LGGTPSVNIGTAGQAHHCTTQSPRKLMVSIHVPEKNVILNLIQLNNFYAKQLFLKKYFLQKKLNKLKPLGSVLRRWVIRKGLALTRS